MNLYVIHYAENKIICCIYTLVMKLTQIINLSFLYSFYSIFHLDFAQLFNWYILCIYTYILEEMVRIY